MSKKTKRFEIEKTFGVDVLLKLTKTDHTGIKVSENDGKYTFNVGIDELNRAVNTTLEHHRISLIIN